MNDSGVNLVGGDKWQERLRRLSAIDGRLAAAFGRSGDFSPWASPGHGTSDSAGVQPARAVPRPELPLATMTPPLEEERDERRKRGGGGAAVGLGRASGRARHAGSAFHQSPAGRPSLAVKLGLATGSQAAVVKLASYASGRASMGALVNYQSRGGELALEREDGSRIEGKAALAEMVATWATETNSRAPSKDSLAFEFSFSGPTDDDAIADRLARAFEGHRYAWRAELTGKEAAVQLVLSAASSRREMSGKPARIFDNRKSLARMSERVRMAFGENAKVGPLSWSHGPEGMARQMRELSRGGSLTLATSTGRSVDSKDAAREVAQSWKRDLRSQNPRDTAHIIISAKPGTPRDAFVDAARATLTQEFVGHKYAFALHSDRAHLHVHAIVRMDSAGGERLDPNIGDFRRWRETMALHARERNIAMEPTSRFDQAATPAYKLADVNALARGAPTERQRRRVEERQTRAVHVPTRDEGVERAQANAREWRTFPEAGPRGVQREPAVPPGHTRLYRAEGGDRSGASAEIYGTTRGAAETLAAVGGGRLVYLDVPEARRSELTPANSKSGLEFAVSPSLAAQARAVPQDTAILNFRERAEAALGSTSDRSRSRAGETTSGENEMRSAAAMTVQLRDIAQSVQELSQMLPEAQRQKLLELGAAFQAKGAEIVASQRSIEHSRLFIEGSSFDPPHVRELPPSLPGFAAEWVGGEVLYSQVDETSNKPVVVFVDTGKSVTIHTSHDENAIRAALHVASEKWGALTLSGPAAFKSQAVRFAAESGYIIADPELQGQLEAARVQAGSTLQPISSLLARDDIALERNRIAIELEAQSETQQARAALAQREANPLQSGSEAPYRPTSEADSAQDSARAVGQNPRQSIPTETTQSQTMRNLSAEREQELNAQRYADLAKKIAREDADKTSQRENGATRDRDDGQER